MYHVKESDELKGFIRDYQDHPIVLHSRSGEDQLGTLEISCTIHMGQAMLNLLAKIPNSKDGITHTVYPVMAENISLLSSDQAVALHDRSSLSKIITSLLVSGKDVDYGN